MSTQSGGQSSLSLPRVQTLTELSLCAGPCAQPSPPLVEQNQGRGAVWTKSPESWVSALRLATGCLWRVGPRPHPDSGEVLSARAAGPCGVWPPSPGLASPVEESWAGRRLCDEPPISEAASGTTLTVDVSWIASVYGKNF